MPDSAEFLVRSSNLRASGRHRVRDGPGPGSGAEPFGHAVSDLAEVDSPKERVDSGDVGLALLGFASGSMDALAFLISARCFRRQ
jgi:hypothetical protein